MTPPGPGGYPNAAELSARHRDPMIELRRRIYARIGERVDPARTRHKPLSLLRQEAKRIAEQFLDSECPLLPRAERDNLLDEVMTFSAGIGPLEELFRDEAVTEILLLAAGQIIARKNESWVPANIRFKDTAQLRTLVNRYAESGTPYVTEPVATGGLDVRLPNNFRMIAILPPDVLGVPPSVLLVRMVKSPSPPPAASRTDYRQATSRPTPSDVEVPLGGPISGIYRPPAGPASGKYPSPSSVTADPLAKIRQRVTEKIITSMASVGVYDLTHLPLGDLRRVVQTYVTEINLSDRLGLDSAMQERLTLEILAGMNRS